MLPKLTDHLIAAAPLVESQELETMDLDGDRRGKVDPVGWADAQDEWQG